MTTTRLHSDPDPDTIAVRLHSAADLRAAIRDLRPDAIAVGIEITSDWCRDQMYALDVGRFEDVDADTLGQIADRVDDLPAILYIADLTVRVPAGQDARAIAIVAAAGESGVVQAADAVRLFPGEPTLHTTLRLSTALEAIGASLIEE